MRQSNPYEAPYEAPGMQTCTYLSVHVGHLHWHPLRLALFLRPQSFSADSSARAHGLKPEVDCTPCAWGVLQLDTRIAHSLSRLLLSTAQANRALLHPAAQQMPKHKARAPRPPGRRGPWCSGPAGCCLMEPWTRPSCSSQGSPAAGGRSPHAPRGPPAADRGGAGALRRAGRLP